MARTTETDYTEIKKYYILNPNVSNQTIAKKFNVTPNALTIQISRHNWKAERLAHWGDLEADYREAAKTRDLIERDELDIRLAKNNKLLLDQVEGHLSAMGVGVDEDGRPTMLRAGVPIKDVTALANIQKIVHESEYRRLNVALPKQPIELSPPARSPGDDVPLPDIDLDIEKKVLNTRYVNMSELPAPDDKGNGKGNGNGG